MTHPPDFEQMARDINGQMDLWIRHSKDAGTWKELAPTAGEEYYTSLVVAGLRQAYQAGMLAENEACALIVDEEGRTNVENPAIDMGEMLRRSGIRWCAEWAARKIRARAASLGGGK